MENVIQETIQYTRQRKIFKQPVLYHQTVRFRLAELQTEVELLRSLVHRATGNRPIADWTIAHVIGGWDWLALHPHTHTHLIQR